MGRLRNITCAAKMFLHLLGKIFASWEANFYSAKMFSQIAKQGNIDRKHNVYYSQKCHRLVSSCPFYRLVNKLVNFIKLQQELNQASYNLSFADFLQIVEKLAASLWITGFDNQLATIPLTTCNRLAINKLSQAMGTHPDIGLLITSLLLVVVFGRVA